MPQIINKLDKKGYVQFERSLMRDKRIKSNNKVMYLLLVSLAETCENVFPSYSWIADEVGYSYNGKHEVGTQEYERAMRKFVYENLEPLIELNMIKKINNIGESCDFEIYSYKSNPEQKSTGTVNKKVQGYPEQKSTGSNKEEERERRRDKESKREQSINNIKTHELFAPSQKAKFSNLNEKEIDLCLLLAFDSNPRLNISSAVNWLETESSKKTRQQAFKKPQGQSTSYTTSLKATIDKPYYRDFATRREYEKAMDAGGFAHEELPLNASSFWNDEEQSVVQRYGVQIKTVDNSYIDEDKKKNELYNQINNL